MVELSSLRDAFIEELRVLYNAEQQLTSALPKMAAAASHPGLRIALARHLHETRSHVARIENAFIFLNEPPRARYYAGIAGIIAEASETMTEEAPPAVMDVCIIAGGLRVGHYQMAAYVTVVALAEALQLPEIAGLLSQNLVEEKAADDQLTVMSEGRINEAMTVERAKTPGSGQPSTHPE